MNFGRGEDPAFRCICRWAGSLPLISEKILFQALLTKTADYPELPAAILAELFMRRWLYPQPQESNSAWCEQLAPYMHRSGFAFRFAEWASAQADEREYEVPVVIMNSAANELEYALVQALKDNMGKWADAHGNIAFIGAGITPPEDQWDTTPPMSDVLLPFRLLERSCHDPAADFGRKAAVLAHNITGPWINLDQVFLNFPTLPRRLPEWMVGESGALAIWFACRANVSALPRKALEYGLAGCLGRWSAAATLDYRTNDGHIVRRKLNLFRSAYVPTIVLPDTMGYVYGGTISGDCVLWPHSQPVSPLMDRLLEEKMAQDPEANEIRRIEAGLVEGEEEVDVDRAYRTLIEMESKKVMGKEYARRINFLAYICCCRTAREAEANKREKLILALPPSEQWDLPMLLRCAWIFSDMKASRLKTMAEKLKKINSEKYKNTTLPTTRTKGRV